MKLSNLLYFFIVPLLFTPSLNASKDAEVDTNFQSVYFEENLEFDRRCSRDLRACESANRYLEREILVVEDELERANRRIKRLQQKVQDYEYQLARYQKRGPKRPRGHGYNTGRRPTDKYRN